MGWRGLVVAAVVMAAGAGRAQPVDPNEDGLGTRADFSQVTVGPLPDRPDPRDTQALLAKWPADPKGRGITLISSIDRSSHLFPVYEQLEAHGGINASLSYVESWLDIPADLRVIFGQCRQKNAFYSPKDKAIVFCYELVASFAEYFRDQQKLSGPALGRAVMGATVFSLLHELGHAFSHLYGFPMLGNEEDAADRIAALLLLEEGAVGTQRAYAGAFGFLALDDGKRPVWFDEHSVGPQRYHNVMCLLVGADPRNLELVSDPGFKEHRAPRCEGEYLKSRASLDVLLQPYYKKAKKPGSRLAELLDEDALPPLLVVERERAKPGAVPAPAGGWPDVVAWRLAHLMSILDLLEQSEAEPEKAADDVKLHTTFNRLDRMQLASAEAKVGQAEVQRLIAKYEGAISDVQKRITALSRRSPRLMDDARVREAIAPLL